MKEPSRLPPLDLLAAFEAAARHLSFTRAGAERFVTQSAMSRQIRALEDDLGVPLFRRRHRALVLTDEGQRLLATCTDVLARLRETVTELRAPARRQVLSLTTTPGMASLWLIPRLPLFTRQHPGIDVRIDTGLEKRDLTADGFDLAIRYFPADYPEGEPLFAESMQPVCSPALLRKGGGPPLRRPADLALHTLLQITPVPARGMPMEWAPWLRAAGVPDLEPAATLSFNAYNEVIAAALAGQGVALGRRPLIDAYIRRRELVTPFRDVTASQRAYFLVVEPSARARPAVRALEAWLREQAARPEPEHD